MKLKTLIFLFAVVLLTSCGKNQSELTGFVGADAEAAYLLHPEDMVRKSGIKDMSSLPDFGGKVRASHTVSTLASLDGIDFKDAVAVAYGSVDKMIGIMAVKDRDDLVKSLEKEDFVVEKVKGAEVYQSPDADYYILPEDDLLFGGSANDAESFVEMVETARSAATTPLPEWKKNLLTAGHEVNGFSRYEGGVLAMNADIDERDLQLEMSFFDANGNAVSPFRDIEYTVLDSNTDCLDNEALVSLAFAKSDYKALLGRLPKGTMSSSTRMILTGILKSIDGPVRGSVSFNGDDFSSFQDYSANIALVATDEKNAKDIVSTAAMGCKGMGFYVKEEKNGFTTRFEGAEITMTSKGKDIKIATDHQINGKKPSGSDVKGAIMWISFNCPEKLLKLLTDEAQFSLKGTLTVRETSMKVFVEVYDTDLTLVDVLGRVAR